MENEKKYEGTVTITSAEYRELVTEAVTQKHLADDYRSEKWKAESERNELKKECENLREQLDNALKELSMFKSHLASCSTGFVTNPCNTTVHNGGNIYGK